MNELFGMKIRVTKACPKDRAILVSDGCFDKDGNIVPERVGVIMLFTKQREEENR